MAQKTLKQETTHTVFGKPRKAAPEKLMPAAQSTRQEYPEVTAAIDKGLADVAAGRIYRMSFAEYAEIPVED